MLVIQSSNGITTDGKLCEIACGNFRRQWIIVLRSAQRIGLKDTAKKFLRRPDYSAGAMPFFFSSSMALAVLMMGDAPMPLRTCGALVNWQSS